MSLLSSPYGRTTRKKDGQPLRTKIVATIGNLGSKSSYTDGVYEDNNRKVPESDLNYSYLVGKFYSKGVDIIRLNLSHLEVDELRAIFPEIKKAILKCEDESEQRNHYRRRIAILADLPGPKIRFRFPKEDGVTFTQGDSFTIHFKQEIAREAVSRKREATVYIDDQPLEKALHEFDTAFLGAAASFAKSKLSEAILQNAFGIMKPEEGGSFHNMMEHMERRGPNSVLVFVGDGDVVLKVTRVKKGSSSCKCEVVVAKQSSLKGDKGFTLKGVDFRVPTFTAADKKKLNALLDSDYEDYRDSKWESVVGFIGLSFTQTAHDVLEIKEHTESRLREKGVARKDARLKSPSIIAKIETRMGWKNSQYILDVADGIMVARGDLGLQMEIAEVPHIQKELIQLCNKRGKPVITATEMLKSMTQSIEPTRAEGADVFNAILDGSDAVMTSEETATGKYPFHSINEAIAIASEAELHFEMKEFGMEDLRLEARSRVNLDRYNDFLNDDFTRIEANTDRFRSFREAFSDLIRPQSTIKLETDKHEKMEWRQQLYQEKYLKSLEQKTTNCITQATCTMSESDHVKAIVAATTSGRTVRMIVRLRPSVIVIGAAHDRINTRKLALSYGVIPICIGKADVRAGTDGIFSKSEEGIMPNQYLNKLLKGEVVVFTAGTKLGEPGTTNSIQMRQISAPTPAEQQGEPPVLV